MEFRTAKPERTLHSGVRKRHMTTIRSDMMTLPDRVSGRLAPAQCPPEVAPEFNEIFLPRVGQLWTDGSRFADTYYIDRVCSK